MDGYNMMNWYKRRRVAVAYVPFSLKPFIQLILGAYLLLKIIVKPLDKLYFNERRHVTMTHVPIVHLQLYLDLVYFQNTAIK